MENNRNSGTIQTDKVNISIAGNVAVITLPVQLDTLKRLEKYTPDALQIKDDNGGLKFKVGTGASGSISKNGVCFNDATRDSRRLACMKLDIPDDVVDAEEYVADYVGQAYHNLKVVLARLDGALTALDRDMAEIKESITFADNLGGAPEDESDNGGEGADND